MHCTVSNDLANVAGVFTIFFPRGFTYQFDSSNYYKLMLRVYYLPSRSHLSSGDFRFVAGSVWPRSQFLSIAVTASHGSTFNSSQLFACRCLYNEFTEERWIVRMIALFISRYQFISVFFIIPQESDFIILRLFSCLTWQRSDASFAAAWAGL